MMLQFPVLLPGLTALSDALSRLRRPVVRCRFLHCTFLRYALG
ncbi:hypothetical protein HNR19_002714 [Nocardioides thalensis]|uniref:Uncharacterized protein n=1 Tax=Nocardioides thalensis TaxID=1914755 RepID=A0A853C4S9_9ACTN|nr:hypothetical protein [Nocardioides thalensis]